MGRGQFFDRLKRREWDDLEFKKARRGVPESAYESVAAFSNTGGGWLVIGVQERGGKPEVVGVPDVDKVQNDFLSTLRSGQKLNRIVTVEARLIEEEGKAVLAFHIPQARRQDKPVYLDGDIRKSFIRRGAGDERCTPTEIERFLRDASEERHDAQTVRLAPERCFDDWSIRWYRALFVQRNPGHDVTLSDLEFLHHWGFVVEADGRLVPTRAAILILGADPAVRQVLPRPVVDWQWICRNWSDEYSEERWADRLVLEVNLVKTWKALVDRYLDRAEKPFSIDPKTLRRNDLPPDYIAFREAVINLLMHQDYADHTRKPVIQLFKDRMRFWNPGDAFAAQEELLDPGEKKVRNPRIVAAFRRIGLSEQAGTGIRSIFRSWQRLGRIPPSVRSDGERNAFELTLLKEQLLSPGRRQVQASLGLRLNDNEANAFALACREGSLSLRDIRALTGMWVRDAQTVLDGLASKGLIVPIENAREPVYALADHVRELAQRTLPTFNQKSVFDPSARPTGQRLPRLAADDRELLPKVTEIQWKVMRFCDVAHSMKDIVAELGMNHRTSVRRLHVEPLLRGGLLRMTHPDRPRHPNQAYVLTKHGVEFTIQRLVKR